MSAGAGLRCGLIGTSASAGVDLSCVLRGASAAAGFGAESFVSVFFAIGLSWGLSKGASGVAAFAGLASGVDLS